MDFYIRGSLVSLLGVLFLLSLSVAEINDDPVVNIPHLGSIRGTILKSAFKQRDILAFRGIPYAKPPVGELRFK